MSTEDNSTDDSTAGSMRKAAENLDHDAGGAPSAAYLDNVDPEEFGRHDDADDDSDEDPDAEPTDGPPDTPPTDR
ncbi:hypothetical protein [Brevibacterium sp. 'Marine']|uniref:hypothetical protein n=1 Tax=Brevibacterium sp. 'Marine' TaxID=2725563 RepID=UPI00145F09CF|nr:hypothetical protein [Brevibacterium sp. 'Marine']